MTGQHSNFGTLWNEAARRIEYLTGGRYIAFPVSNGTDAVALGIYAAHREYAPAAEWAPTINVEAFTFRATFCAAEMVSPNDVVIIETDEVTDPSEINVRTKWWGYNRDLSSSTANDVIDAAGGFGRAAAFENIGRDSIVAVSFHATKNFPIGEGGAVLVPRHRKDAAVAVRRAMCFGFDTDRNVVESFGINAKLDELRCSLLIEQLDSSRFFEARSDRIGRLALHIAEHVYAPSTGNVAPSGCPPPGSWASLPVVPVPRANELINYLAEHGYQCRRTYELLDGYGDYQEWQRSCVAFPADMNALELVHFCDLLDAFYKKVDPNVS